MAEQNDQTLSFSERCGQFLTQHRKPIVIILGAICAVVAIALIVSALTIRSAKNASVETEAIISEWTDLRNKNAEDMAAKEDVLVEKLEKQAAANGHTYAAFRAYTTLGEIYTLRKDWEKAANALNDGRKYRYMMVFDQERLEGAYDVAAMLDLLRSL